jgi:hypothetical protein
MVPNWTDMFGVLDTTLLTTALLAFLWIKKIISESKQSVWSCGFDPTNGTLYPKASSCKGKHTMIFNWGSEEPDQVTITPTFKSSLFHMKVFCEVFR